MNTDVISNMRTSLNKQDWGTSLCCFRSVSLTEFVTWVFKKLLKEARICSMHVFACMLYPAPALKVHITQPCQ